MADRLAKLTESSLAFLAGLPAGHDRAKDDATAAALTLLGRLANLDHVTMDTDAATVSQPVTHSLTHPLTHSLTR